MASCCSFADSAKNHFDKKDAEKTLARYLSKGPDETTRLLGERLAAEGLASGTVLDIGAGLGFLSLELLRLGADRSTAVDASAAFIETGRLEAKRQGKNDRVSFIEADFVQVAESMPPATLVVMDRAVCCYPDYTPLLNAAVARATAAFAFSYPRDRWFVRMGIALENSLRRFRADPFRAFVHPVTEMQRLVTGHGLELVTSEQTTMWSIEVYRRMRGPTPMVFMHQSEASLR